MAANKDKDIWQGFISAMIHDIAKVIEFSGLFKKEETSHKYLGKYLEKFKERYNLSAHAVPDEVLTLHEDKEKADRKGVALTLADRISKEIQGFPSELEKDNALKELRKNPMYYPYWGYPKEWNQEDMLARFGKIYTPLTNEIKSVKPLLEMQNHMRDFPHTSYLPHLSLAIHHQFSGVLYWLLMPKLKTLRDYKELQNFGFSVIEVRPFFTDVVFRLRDVLVRKELGKRLKKGLFEAIYGNYSSDLDGIFNYNPFVFYSGDSYVCICNDYEAFRSGIASLLAKATAIKSIDINAVTYKMKISWQDNVRGGKVELAEKPIPRKETLLSKTLQSFDKAAWEKCEFCQMPCQSLEADDKGNLLCKDCLDLRKEISTGIDIDRVATTPEGEEKRIAYVALTFPDNLLEHAREVAKEKLIPGFFDRNRLPQPDGLSATETGLYEYLQALSDMSQFDDFMDKEIEKMKGKENAAHTLFLLPSLKMFLFREDLVLEFLAFLYSVRPKMRLQMGVKIIVCDSKTPFWSLIQKSMGHSENDTFYDISRGKVTMFKDEEVLEIRKLANLARAKKVWPTQLHNVSAVALKTTLEELLLELDVRKERLKGMANELNGALNKLGPQNDFETREKRAVFLKYIANLSKTGGR